MISKSLLFVKGSVRESPVSRNTKTIIDKNCKIYTKQFIRLNNFCSVSVILTKFHFSQPFLFNCSYSTVSFANRNLFTRNRVHWRLEKYFCSFLVFKRNQISSPFPLIWPLYHLRSALQVAIDRSLSEWDSQNLLIETFPSKSVILLFILRYSNLFSQVF